MVYVFKNWKLLFENICGNMCEWKSALKCVKYCLKTKNGCLKIQTKHPLSLWADKEEEAVTAEAEDNGTVLMTAVTQKQEQVNKLLRKERDY